MTPQKNDAAKGNSATADPYPGIAVVTINYNDVKGLRETCRSVMSQDMRPAEWIIVDGASSDGTQEFLPTLTEHATKIVSEPDKGIYDAHNKGAKLATAPWVMFLNGGDTLAETGTLTALTRTLAEAGDAAVVYGDVIIFDGAGKEFYRRGRPIGFLRLNNMTSHQSCIYRREIFDNNPYDLDFPICADYDLHCRLYAAGARFKYVPLAIARYLAGGSSDIKWRAREREIAQIRARTFTGGTVMNAVIGVYRPIIERMKQTFPDQVIYIRSVLRR